MVNLMKFPIFKTKVKGVNKKFNLNDPKERAKYFELKCGLEIKKLKDYLKYNTFIAYLLGKKNSGKGTYAKMLAEIIGSEKIDHFSIGDMIRGIDPEMKDPKKKKELVAQISNVTETVSITIDNPAAQDLQRMEYL